MVALHIAPEFVARGLSCRVGGYLAGLLARARHCPEWARVMHAEIKKRFEPPRDEADGVAG